MGISIRFDDICGYLWLFHVYSWFHDLYIINGGYLIYELFEDYCGIYVYL